MASYTFEHDGNRGLLTLITHNNKTVIIECLKESHQTFRIGGTASDGPLLIPGRIISISDDRRFATIASLRNPALIINGLMYEDTSIGETAIATEYYEIDMEGKPPSWLISRNVIDQCQILFLNIDCIDGGGNVCRRYRVSPFNGSYKVMESLNGT